jgi:hypothetical protein
MHIPSVATWMKQRDLGVTPFVMAGVEVRFEQITGAARQSEILKMIGAAARLRMDMLSSKGKLKTFSGARQYSHLYNARSAIAG